jgi:hypothetical protein
MLTNLKNIFMLTTKLTLFFIFSIIDLRVSAAAEIYQAYTGARELAMGGAYVTTVNDETALELNPAGLGRLRGRIFTLLDPELDLGANDQKIFSASTSYLDMFNAKSIMDNSKSSPATHFHLKAQLMPSIVLPNFGFGVHGMRRYDAEADATATNFHLDYTQDVDAVFGLNFKLFDGILKVGASARYIDHAVISKDFVIANTTAISVENSGSEGTGVGVIVGAVFTAPVTYLPSIGFTVHDLGNTNYNIGSGAFYQVGASRPPETTQTIDGGIGLFPILGSHTRAAFTAEIHDVATLATETDLFRRAHAGLEINIGDILFVRAGLNQRYYTAGLEFASERLQFQATTYGEEIGTATAPREDRRFLGKFAFRF